MTTLCAQSTVRARNSAMHCHCFPGAGVQIRWKGTRAPNPEFILHVDPINLSVVFPPYLYARFSPLGELTSRWPPVWALSSSNFGVIDLHLAGICPLSLKLAI